MRKILTLALVVFCQMLAAQPIIQFYNISDCNSNPIFISVSSASGYSLQWSSDFGVIPNSNNDTLVVMPGTLHHRSGNFTVSFFQAGIFQFSISEPWAGFSERFYHTNSCSPFGCEGVAGFVVNTQGPRSYLWSSGFTGNLSTGLCAGNYAITVTRPGCQYVENFTVGNTPAGTHHISAQYNTGCTSATLNVNSQYSIPYPINASYYWNNGATTNSINVNSAGNYTVSIHEISCGSSLSSYQFTPGMNAASLTPLASPCGTKYFFTLLTFTLSACGQTKDDRTILGKPYAEQELKSALTDKSQHNVIDNKTSIIKDSLTAINIAEPILFSIYGKDNITKQRPYEIYFIDSYWIIRGTLPKEYLGGTFLIIIDSRNCKIIRITHGK